MSASLAHAAPDEVRGVWLTTTGPDHIRSGRNTAATMAGLADIGLNTVYIETWKSGYTQFPSQALRNLIGRDRAPGLGARDLLAETTEAAHREGLHTVAWFEYGFMAEFVGNGGGVFTPLGREAERRNWLLEDRNGNYGNATNGFAWMNPAVPEVRQLLIDISLEAITNYDLDGIQLDDRLAWPNELGFDATTQSLYTSQTGNPIATSPTDPAFTAWRRQQVTSFAQEWTAAIRSARPDLLVSVSPSITTFSETNFNADWPAWQDAGLFDEYAVQVYRDNLNSFQLTMPNQVAAFTNQNSNDLDEFVVGLRANGTGANTPYNDLESMIDATRVAGAAGHSIFYSKALIDDGYGASLTAYYDVANLGPAAHPAFGPDHRPLPSAGEEAGRFAWTFDIPADGVYSLRVRDPELPGGDVWTEQSIGWFPAGERTLFAFTNGEVELLRNHLVEPTLPDFNGNGRVDSADYTIWRDTFASTSDLRADANGDGFVNASDFDLWLASFGRTAAGSSAVPEPSAAAALGLLLSPVRSRRRR